ncbi:TonB-dependent receptor domain-containing protein [Pontibacter silvestris]|uniref:TonB-dependent receptor domain-containing protein n=1 Tax=Pontibacter silvestris TaxID=2305183 RepID=A0ABW4WUQ7_9BACT|nr:TonB-dependent receptor [Pontibacter silvestris]MCC9136451.1 outer membrane beta-barrel protein [Pontibacter silvestris]
MKGNPQTIVYTLCLLLLSLSFCSPILAATIKGKVQDKVSSEPLVGAYVSLKNTSTFATVGLDGSYKISDLQAGTYALAISYMGYKTLEKEVTIAANSQTITLDLLLESQHQQLSEIMVTARADGGSDRTARQLERNADQVLNIVSSRAIQISPDLTVANVVQRVSGVSIERNSNGDGQYAILRGMDKRYNYTLVNGIKIPSPDNKYRYVPLDIFPSELLERLEVYKALTPSMEGDAIGGAINMQMKDAPEYFQVSANIATGYSQLFLDRDFLSYNASDINYTSPYEQHGSDYNATASDFPSGTINYKAKRPMPNLLGGFSVGNRFFDNKLGVIVAGSYQNTYRGSNSLFFNSTVVDTDQSSTVTDMQERQYSEQQNRYGLHTKLDYRLNQRHKLQLYNAYLNLTNIQTRDAVTTQLSYGGYDAEAGNAGLTYVVRSRLTEQKIYSSTLHGEHQLLDNLKVRWSGVYSSATSEEPDNTTVTLRGIQENFNRQPTTVEGMTRRWEHNSDRDLTGYLDVTYTVPVAGVPVAFSAGGLYRDKKRDNFYNNYLFSPQNVNALYGTDYNSYTDIQWKLQNPRGSVASALSYDATENITAGYGQFKLETLKMQVTGGVRVEATDQGYSMRFPLGELRPESNQVYTDVLPSLHLKYKPWQNQNIRASYFRSINRPGFFEIVPYKIVNEDYNERGNPDLQRAIADNLDLRYEFFPNATDQLLVGVFYKHIQNPIEYTLQRDETRGQDIFYAPGNFGDADNYGVEVDWIKYFRNVGIKANYTYTNSQITTSKMLRVRDEENGDLKAVNIEQTRPLYGQSAHVANLSLLYKDTRTGWNGQVAASYTGDRINTVSQFLDNDLWQKGFVQLDASVEKRFKHLTVFLKANNLLNTPMEVYIKNANSKNSNVPHQSVESGKTLIRRDYYKQSYLIGVRINF